MIRKSFQIKGFVFKFSLSFESFKARTFERILAPNWYWLLNDSSFAVFFIEGGPASVVMWDSQIKDVSKRSQADGSTAVDAPIRVAWDGQKTSNVVEELLKNSSDKAYGANGEEKAPIF